MKPPLALTALALAAIYAIPSYAASENQIAQISTVRSKIAAQNYTDAMRLLIHLVGEVEERMGHSFARPVPSQSQVGAVAPNVLLDRAEASLGSAHLEDAATALWAASLEVAALQTQKPAREQYQQLAAEAQSRGSAAGFEHAALTAYRSQDLVAAELYTTKALALLKGNPMANSATVVLGRHRIYTLQGFIYLSRGDFDSASSAMMESLSGFDSSRWPIGPSMSLAQKLLHAGRRDAVISYLEACRKVGWKEGQAKLPDWIAAIRAGSVPAFDRSSLIW